jgi:hypothetical protein
MRWNELTMSGIEHGKRKGYQAGCRCDLCKDAEADYRREHRRLCRERVGDGSGAPAAGLSLVTNDGPVTPTCGDAPGYSVVEGVLAEIELFGGSKRPALENAALALAAVLDNPKATATKPAAAAKLADLLEQMRRGADQKESRLAKVRSMTKPQVKTG